jgi:transposase InsO family protein
MGPFPHAVGGFRFLYVAIDKVTKWSEATPVVKINKQSVVKFIKSIICRFGAPNRININNGSQFTSGAFQGYCEDLDIQICYDSVTHSESNGQVERANAEILKGLKTCTYDGLKKHGKKWIDELPCTLWGIGHHPFEPRARRLSSWCMRLRLSSPGGHHGLSTCQDIQ